MNLTIMINNVPIQCYETPSGGRITFTTNGYKVFRVYTHPSRAKNVNRLRYDVHKVYQLYIENSVL